MTDIAPVENDACRREMELLALQLKALGHPVRVEMIRLLKERDRCCCGDFCATLPLAQSTVSQHLEMLRRAELVDYEAEGNRSRYSLNRTAFKALAKAVQALAQDGEGQILQAHETPESAIQQ